MSLIEEALRKQRQETEQGESSKVQSDEPTPPPPLPEEENAEASDAVPQRWTWPLLAGIAGGSLILIAGIFWLLIFGMKIWNTKPVDKAVQPVATAPVMPAVTNVQRDRVGLQPPKAESLETNRAAQPPTNTPSAAVAATVVIPPSLPSAAATSAPSVVAAPIAAPPVVATNSDETKIIRIGAGVSTTSVPDKVMAVIWPRLAVSGIIGNSRGSRGAVIINGQMLSIGSTIEGVKIVAIDKQGVQLRLGDETRTLTVGSTTE